MTDPSSGLLEEGSSCVTTLKSQLGEEFLGHNARPEVCGRWSSPTAIASGKLNYSPIIDRCAMRTILASLIKLAYFS